MSDDAAKRALITCGLLDERELERLNAALDGHTWPEALHSIGLHGEALDDALEVVETAPSPLFSSVVTTESPDRYARVSLLGAGGMGQVALVEDRHLQREVARKELHAQRPAMALRFLREARITARLEHPGIVPIYELGRNPKGNLYYTMKRIEGRTLREAIDAAPTLADRLRLLTAFVEACHAVGYAHSKGVVHRDLKPENVMIGPFGETLVLDWGLARVAGEPEPAGSGGERTGSGSLGSGASDLTRAGTVMGTPRYMSPEQAAGRLADIDPRSDVWSLGVMLYELLCGEPPFSGDPDSVLHQVRQGHVSPVQDAGPDVPAELAAICSHALGASRAERYDHAGELAEELEAWRAGATVRAHVYSPFERARRLMARFRTVGIAAAATALGLAATSLWWAPRLTDARGEASELHARIATLERVVAAGELERRDPGRALALLRDAAHRAAPDDRTHAERRIQALLDDGADVRVFPRDPHSGPPFWSSTGGMLAWTTPGGVAIVDPASGAALGTVTAARPRAAAFSPDDERMLVLDGDRLREVALVDSRERRSAVAREAGVLTDPIAIEVLPDGRIALTSGDRAVAVDLDRGFTAAIEPRPAATERARAERGRIVVGEQTFRVGSPPGSIALGPRELAAVVGDEVRVWWLGPPPPTPKTNLRVCPDGRVVPVLPFPRASDLDPHRACGRP